MRMKKPYYIKYNKYGKFRNPKISYIFDKTLVLSINCDKCHSKDEKEELYSKKKNLLRY